MMMFNNQIYRHNIVRLMCQPLLGSRLLLLIIMLSFCLSQHVHAATTDWTIKINSSVGEYKSGITLGEFADASDGYDIKYDAPAHTASAAVVAYFDHPEWGLADTKFWYDIQSKGNTRQWTFNTDSNLDGQELSLEWNFFNVPDGYQVTLTDTTTGQSVDMTSESSYSYVSGSLRKFTLSAALKDAFTPTSKDTDGDGLVDEWELTYFDSLTSLTAGGDEDNDGLVNSNEYANGTHPVNADSDGDGGSDSDELWYGSNPVLGSDTIDLHRPYPPVLQQNVVVASLDGQNFDSEAFNDTDILDGDYLSASQWQISTDQDFSTTAMVFDRELVRDSSADSNSVDHRQLSVPRGVLEKDGQYSIRTRHQDRTGLWSAWSDAITFNTVDTDANDLLGDGIDDRYQVETNVDTNNNSVDDNDEDTIKPIYTASFSDAVGLATSSGDISFLSVMNVMDININSDLLPSEAMPYHLFDFRVDGLPMNSNNPTSVEITFYFPSALPADTKWYKFDAATGWMSDYTNLVVINDNQVTLTLTDGGAGDADGVVNGVIIDPSGPALPDGANQSSNSSATSAVNSGGSGAYGPVLLVMGLLTLCLQLSRKNGVA